MSLFLQSRGSMLRAVLWAILVVGMPLALAFWVLGLDHWNLSIPLVYDFHDATWQLILTKMLVDTGWVLTDPYLGAPGIAHWYNNPAAQTSALHSVLMLGLSTFISNAVRLQQVYYLLNFPLICATSFFAARLLGISRMPAFAVGMLFAFTTFRIDYLFYSFLPNYFLVPLALVAVIWVLSGRFAQLFDAAGVIGREGWHQMLHVLRSRDFLLGLLFVLLVAVSDGYYAFFTLLLLGFAVAARVAAGDWRRPAALVPAAVFICTLMGAALALQWPLHTYKETHRNEFYPHGIQDPVLVKHPFEAEVYSTSLKMLIAPIPANHIPVLGKLGTWMLQTNDEARAFKQGKAPVPLGTLGSLLFAVALTMVAIPAVRRGLLRRAAPTALSSKDSAKFLPEALLSLVLFIFLCSIFGGVGTLIALVFPTIRAYDRFPLFLIFVLYLGGAWFITQKLRSSGALKRSVWTGFLVLVTIAALYDQIPADSRKGSAAVKVRFLAEGNFVRQVEAALPPDAMVFQFPYSQYLRESEYYGWGSFAGERLYVQSHDLRWSNGGAKNSSSDNWDHFISQLPPDDMITEAEAAGFKGFVIDRTVVKTVEYETFRRAFLARGDHILDDAASKLAFVRLRDPGYRLTYDQSYKEANGITVTDPMRLLEQTRFSRYVHAEALKRFVASHHFKAGDEISRTQQPALFADTAVLMRGMGQVAIKPITDMRGQMTCKLETAPAAEEGAVVLRLDNQTPFDWRLDQGPFPIRIGLHVLQANGKMLRWDDGYRVPSHVYIRRDSGATIRVPLGAIPLGVYPASAGPLAVQFALVQDGNAWFNDISCTLPLQ